MEQSELFEMNRTSWNKRVAVHMKSDFYFLEEFLNGKTSLNEIELNLLGDIRGKSILHLQCHFGQDSLSLARMGAEVTGVDLSDTAIEKAKELNTQMNLNAEFVCCNVYDLKDHLDKKFDIVFTSYGTIGWLPDLNRWADVVSHFLNFIRSCGCSTMTFKRRDTITSMPVQISKPALALTPNLLPTLKSRVPFGIIPQAKSLHRFLVKAFS